MRHRKSGKKLGRSPSHRLAMFNNLLMSFFDHERIVTTETKAKELKRQADRMLTLAKKGTLASRRHAAKHIKQPALLQKLFGELGPRYADRPGGYSRIYKLARRQGDGAPMCVIELIPEDEPCVPKKRKASVDAAPAEAVETKESFEEASVEEAPAEETPAEDVPELPPEVPEAEEEAKKEDGE